MTWRARRQASAQSVSSASRTCLILRLTEDARFAASSAGERRLAPFDCHASTSSMRRALGAGWRRSLHVLFAGRPSRISASARACVPEARRIDHKSRRLILRAQEEEFLTRLPLQSLLNLMPRKAVALPRQQTPCLELAAQRLLHFQMNEVEPSTVHGEFMHVPLFAPCLSCLVYRIQQ